MRLAVVIPAYNEEANIKSLLESIGRTTIESIEITPVVVNDCSGDRTAEIVKKTGTELIDLPVNLGIGGAVQTGMVFALENGFDLAVQVDGDGQHPPQEISKLIDKMLSSEADVVIGSRFLKKEGFQSSGIRRLGINYLRFVIKTLTGLDITDSTSGFRLYNRRALQLINDYYPDEYPEPEAVIYFHKKGLKIVETPVLMQSRKGGKTSITFFNSIYYFWKVSLAIIFSYLKS
jgi:glycosyltransferase involved in cell wall biosynthesis